jgi:serine phosphatase RsbU (regulator of sigma subunit)
MGMFKSAMHTNLQKNLSLAEVLNEANLTLYQLKKRTMFLTCAAIRFSGNQTAEFSVAGHLPILHYRAQSGSIEQLREKQIPLSVQADYRFATQEVSYSPGDCFALVTDGLSETTNQKDKEFGLERIESLVRENQQQSLEKLFEIVLAAVNDHGPRKDDQTLMFIRCL